MRNLVQSVCVLFVLAPSPAFAGPAEEANAAIDAWASTYNANDLEGLIALYTPDATLLGTFSPAISDGADGIRKIFGALKGSGNKNVIGERRTVVLGDNAVLVTGFYEFTRLADGRPIPAPSRFTMLLTKRDGQWRLAHHHSSPRPQAR